MKRSNKYFNMLRSIVFALSFLLELDIQHAKIARRHYVGPMTSRDVIGLSPVTISLVRLYNNCFLTVEDYAKETHNKFQALIIFTIHTL